MRSTERSTSRRAFVAGGAAAAIGTAGIIGAPGASADHTASPGKEAEAATSATTQSPLTAPGGLQVGDGISVGQTKWWIAPSGDTSGATDVKNINEALADNWSATLLPGNYFINSPILPTTNSLLWGQSWWSASTNTNYGAGNGKQGGTSIWMTPTFTGDAAISFPDPGSTQMYGVDLAGFMIEGYSITANEDIYGVHAVGAWGGVFMRGLCIHRPPSDCFKAEPGSTGKVPDTWTVSQCEFSASRFGYSLNLNHMDDSWFTDCDSNSSYLGGNWVIAGVNTRFNSCKSENHINGSGWRLGGLPPGQAQWFVGCGTHINPENGFLFDNSGGFGADDSMYVLTGCVAQQDGQSGTEYAGYYSDGCVTRIIMTGCVTQKDTAGAPPPSTARTRQTHMAWPLQDAFFKACIAASPTEAGTRTHRSITCPFRSRLSLDPPAECRVRRFRCSPPRAVFGRILPAADGSAACPRVPGPRMTRTCCARQHADRYQFHDLLRTYAAELAAADEPLPERTAALRRVLTWYLHTAESARPSALWDGPPPPATPQAGARSLAPRR